MAAASSIGAEKIPEWIEPVWEAFLAELKGDSQGHFFSTLEDVLDRAMRENNDLLPWQGAISVLRRRLLSILPVVQHGRMEAVLAQARIVISEGVQRAHAYWQWQSERQGDNLRETARMLLTTFHIPELSAALEDCLPRLGIPSAYLALYEEAEGSLEYARLVMAYTDGGKLALEPQGRRFPAKKLIPADFLPRHRRYSLVVEPLFFQNKAIGYVVFEIGPRQGDIYELLRSNLSSALQGASLFREIQQARLTAEKADRIKTRLLANVSHELRTPLNIILGYTQNSLKVPAPYPRELPPSLISDLQQIQQNAEHQLRVINDLLDLSRAEIDELDLNLELINPRPLLTDAFHSLADHTHSQAVQWKLEIPERLPVIRADALRLRQILLNLLSNARKFTEKGCITFGAELVPPRLHIWISDTGIGIPPEQQERIFEPFVTAENDQHIPGGIGLGLSITRHLVALHQGSLTLESQPGKGSTFHIYLPLPALNADQIDTQPAQPVILYLSSSDTPPAAIVEMGHRQGLEVRPLRSGDDLESLLTQTQPTALAWDLSLAQAGDWALVRRLRHWPQLTRIPFILYGGKEPAELGVSRQTSGLIGFIVKSVNEQSLLDMIEALCPVHSAGPVLIVDDDPQARANTRTIVEEALPDCRPSLAENGQAALAAMRKEIPALVILDMLMPGLSGADVLDRMRADPRLRQIPVVILSNKALSQEDVKRLEGHTQVTFQSKGLLSTSETMASLHRALLGSDTLPPQTSAVVKRAVAYLHENYTHPLSRWQVASSVGVSEDYLSRVFSRELGVPPWDYLNRYRVLRAKELLRRTSENIGNVALQVGFKDQAYFSRVFHRLTGLSPQNFRESQEDV